MPNVNTINFGPGQANADLQAQQIESQRRQQLADMLKQQAMAPIEQQQVSGRVVPISPWQGIFKMAQAGLGGYFQGQADKEQRTLGNESAKRVAGALRALAPAGVFEDPSGGGQQAGLPGQSQDLPLNDVPQMSMPAREQAAPKLDPSIKAAWVRALTVAQTNPELGNKLIQNLAELTTDQKNNAAEGVDSRLAGALRVAKMRKEGIIEYQPGTTSQDLATGAQRFQPKLGEGIMPTADGGAQAIPGYGPAAAGIAGQTAQAQAAAQAGYQLKEITGPDGVPRMMTAQQAAQLAGGGAPAAAAPGTQGMPVVGPPNMGFPANTPVPAPTPGGPSRLDILLQEQQRMQADPRTNPADMAAIGREIAGAGGARAPQGQPAAPAMPGIPMQSDAQHAAQVGAAQNQVELDKSLRLNAQSPEAQQKIIDAQSVLSLAKEASPLLDVATGSGAGEFRDYLYSKVGKDTDASKAAAKLAAIGGQMVSKMPKMSGPQSDKDVQLYKEMAGKIGDPGVTSGNKRAALETIQRLNEKYLSQNQGSMPAAAARAVQGTPNSSIEDLLKKYGGR